MAITNFKNKTVFISGAGSGIGAATALLFAQHQAHLILIGRRIENLQQTSLAAKQFGAKVDLLSLDINNLDEIRAFFSRIDRLDIAVNNAGIEGAVGDTLDLTEADFNHVMDTNVKALWVCMQEQIKWFRQHNQPGNIVNISSIAGIRGFAESGLYVTSKHAVIGMSQAIALEQIKHNIRINVVSPGSIDTPMLNRLFPNAAAEMGPSQPMKRIGKPEEIAEVILWLASEQSSFVVGHNLVVDGGRTISG
ncbi:MAG: hypothetical protein RJB66_987 [Pseudomonadota bacterium]